jgi:predicted dehydrogenase
MNTTKVGVIGCGNISGAYFGGMKKYPFLEIAACADLIMDRAKAAAEKWKVPRACTVAELLADPDIRIVVNLTIPKEHAKVNETILKAGKVAYTEKPFAVTAADAARVLALAKSKNLRTGCAPDTFLGGGFQTGRQLLDAGAIGKPVAGTAFLFCHGHETWHPDPEFYYKPGGGPMLDMGPYYVTGLVSLLGPVKRVAGITAMSFPTRTITSQPLSGTVIKVETPTHLAGTLEFVNGCIVNIATSFDVWRHSMPIMELYGTEGSMSLPDPNTFLGPVKVAKAGDKDWTEMPLTHSDQTSRGIGVADMAKALAAGRPARAAGEMAAHVLDVMLAFNESSKAGKYVTIASRCDRPAPLPPGLPLGEMD